MDTTTSGEVLGILLARRNQMPHTTAPICSEIASARSLWMPLRRKSRFSDDPLRAERTVSQVEIGKRLEFRDAAGRRLVMLQGIVPQIQVRENLAGAQRCSQVSYRTATDVVALRFQPAKCLALP
eukprot:3737879-Rhodomonas_salina.3